MAMLTVTIGDLATPTVKYWGLIPKRLKLEQCHLATTLTHNYLNTETAAMIFKTIVVTATTAAEAQAQTQVQLIVAVILAIAATVAKQLHDTNCDNTKNKYKSFIRRASFQVRKFANSQVCNLASFQTRKFANSQVRKLASFQTRKFASSPTCKFASYQARKYANSKVSNTCV